MSNKLLIISIDALNAKDYDFIKALPVFKDFIENGSVVKSVDSIYPTLTYCCHTSIITGTYPERHGIFHNEKIDTDHYMNQDWFWYAKDIKVPTLFDLANKESLKTCSILWPAMAGNKSLDYNIPEIWSETGESSLSLFLKYGTLKILPQVLKHRGKLDGKKQPNVDNFTEAVTLELIKHKKIDLMAIHFTELDDMRHRKGVFSPEAYKSLKVINKRLEHIMIALKIAGDYNSTNIILMGDHGGNDFDKVICLNSLFMEAGLIEVNEENEIVNWDAYANSAGGSAQVHLRKAGDSDVYHQVEDLLNKITLKPDSPIKSVITRHKARCSERLFGSFSFVLEAKDGYRFMNYIKDSWIVDASTIPNCYKSDHGYLPSHPNLKTMLLAKGPDINQGFELPNCSLIDLGPTFASLLNLEFDDIDGMILQPILKI